MFHRNELPTNEHWLYSDSAINAECMYISLLTPQLSQFGFNMYLMKREFTQQRIASATKNRQVPEALYMFPTG